MRGRIILGLTAWITLTTPDHTPCYINTDGPQFVGPGFKWSRGRTQIILSGGNAVYVLETPDQVMKAISEAVVGIDKEKK